MRSSQMTTRRVGVNEALRICAATRCAPQPYTKTTMTPNIFLQLLSGRGRSVTKTQNYVTLAQMGGACAHARAFQGTPLP